MNIKNQRVLQQLLQRLAEHILEEWIGTPDTTQTSRLAVTVALVILVRILERYGKHGEAASPRQDLP